MKNSKINFIVKSPKETTPVTRYIEENINRLSTKLKNDSEYRHLILNIFLHIEEIDAQYGWNEPHWCGTCNGQHYAERVKAAILGINKYKNSLKNRYGGIL